MLLSRLKSLSIHRKCLSSAESKVLTALPVHCLSIASQIHYINTNYIKQKQTDDNKSVFLFNSNTMSRRCDSNAVPPRKIPRFMNSSMYSSNQIGDYNGTNFCMDLTPPPPPPLGQIMNCGELREHHHGAFVEMDGKVNRTRMGRFIELKDQYGVTQLVAPIDNINVSKRFANMPINSFITIVGQVKRRPVNLINYSMPTGEVEVHVDNIIRVQKTYRSDSSNNAIGGKRHYSTAAAIPSNDNSEKLVNGKASTALTTTEFRHANNNDNLLQWFINRKHTCNSLRLENAGKIVSLVGWIEKKQSKFIHLADGYGNTQVLVENELVKAKINEANESDLLVVRGRVLARPKSHITHNNATGEIELYADHVSILNPNVEYKDAVDGANSNDATNHLSLTKPEIDVNIFTDRTHHCNELTEEDIDKEVTLCGWLEYSRMKKFLTLRDGYGHVQILIPDHLINTVEIQKIPFESILKVKGRVIPRPPKMINKNMKTGAIEVEMISCDLLNAAKPDLPIQVRSFNRSNDPLRMKHRYIDLRFADMQRNLRMRSHVLKKMRDYLIDSVGFVEVETPTLFRRTPGGAQEFVVPTQKPGQFYSLVQSPQQFKQMLMAGAIDRYFQIARCYRDETTTVNRQPEFTQLDIELSFTKPDYILELIENVLRYSWPCELNSISTPFKRMTFNDVMDKYGSDKPDTRSDEFLLENISDVFDVSDDVLKKFKNFAAYVIPLRGQMAANFSNSDGLILKGSASQAKNIEFVFSRINEDWFKGNLKNINESTANAIIQKLNLQSNDMVILAYGNKLNVQNILGKLRLELITNYTKREILPKLADDHFEFLWIVDFPLFTPNGETGVLETTHHPFTAPHPDDLHLLSLVDDYDQCRSLAYDLVLNGQEIGGGSIRIHDASLQRKILNDILKLNTEHLTHLIDALESGCPPHGGIALGLDRLISIMCQTSSIRDVIAFPKSFEGKDLLSKAPCEISKEELNLYHLDIKKP